MAVKEVNGRVSEILWSKTAPWFAVETEVPLHFRPGQFFQALSPDEPDASLAQILFPASLPRGSTRFSPPVPPGWAPGTPVRLRGPFGNGADLPASTRRLALAASAAGIFRLLPLIEQSQMAKVEVTLYTDQVPDDLPPSIEILPPAQLMADLGWADTLVMDVELPALPETLLAFRHIPARNLPMTALIQVFSPMPCANHARCGVCSVKTRQGWKLACKDGPLFSLTDLLE